MHDVVAVVRETRGTSAQQQLQQVVKWANENDARVVKVVSPEADELGRVCDSVRTGAATGVVVAVLDALGDVVHQEVFRAVLAKAGGALCVVDPAGAAQLAAPEGLREVLRETTEVMYQLQGLVQASWMTRGAEKRRKITGRSGGRAPFGMKFIAGELVEDSRETAAKTRMIQLREQGHGYSAIARRLKVEGYLKRNGSDEWHPDMVRRVLMREGTEEAS